MKKALIGAISVFLAGIVIYFSQPDTVVAAPEPSVATPSSQETIFHVSGTTSIVMETQKN